MRKFRFLPLAFCMQSANGGLRWSNWSNLSLALSPAFPLLKIFGEIALTAG